MGGERLEKPAGMYAWLAAALILFLVVVGVALAACRAERRIVLFGSGSTFVEPAMVQWIRGFHSVEPSVEVNYIGGGSGKGQEDILGGKADFACSDPPLKRQALEAHRGEILQFPVVLGAIVVTYNLPGVNESINMSARVLAGIYLGMIKYWDDPEILQLNPGLRGRVPHKPIIAVHRSDASGTTQIFTTFLYKATNGYWPRSLVGKVVPWPVDEKGNGLGEQGNPGVASAVEGTPYSIGYIEWAYALQRHLPIARIENPHSLFVKPSRESVEAAYEALETPGPAGDWTVYVYNAIYSDASPKAYPIVGQTFMIVWRYHASREKCQALKAFIEYIAGPGQEQVLQGYAPLPENLRRVALEAAGLLECRG